MVFINRSIPVKHTTKFIRDRYFTILWGCREIINKNAELDHSEGAWILVNEGQEDLFSEEMFLKALTYLRKSSAQLIDFELKNKTNDTYVHVQCVNALICMYLLF